MATLRDPALKFSYGPSDHWLRDFFIPGISASICYERAAGWSSSRVLANWSRT